jgi:hypothetical protein
MKSESCWWILRGAASIRRRSKEKGSSREGKEVADQRRLLLLDEFITIEKSFLKGYLKK